MVIIMKKIKIYGTTAILLIASLILTMPTMVKADETWDPMIYDSPEVGTPPGNNNGNIDYYEAINAIQDYFNSLINYSQVMSVIDLYEAELEFWDPMIYDDPEVGDPPGNNNGKIDYHEVVNALWDYFDNIINQTQVNEVIELYNQSLLPDPIFNPSPFDNEVIKKPSAEDADVNDDGVADSSDIVTVESHFGEIVDPAGSEPWDLNSDGVVDLSDVNMVKLYNWNSIYLKVDIVFPNDDFYNVSFYWEDGTLIQKLTNINNSIPAQISVDVESLNCKYSWYIVIDNGIIPPAQSNVWNYTIQNTTHSYSLNVHVKPVSFGQVIVEITNEGDSDISDVEWNITINGGIFNLINVSAGGVIDNLDKDETVLVYTEDHSVFGLGKAEIYAEARVDYYSSGHYSLNTRIIGALILT
jgi:hypothetical protein